MVIVRYKGFLQTVERTFESLERAVQWARQCGVFRIATFSVGGVTYVRDPAGW